MRLFLALCDIFYLLLLLQFLVLHGSFVVFWLLIIFTARL